MEYCETIMYKIPKEKIKQAYINARTISEEREKEIEEFIEAEIDKLMSRSWFFRPKSREDARLKVVYMECNGYILSLKKDECWNKHLFNHVSLNAIVKLSELSEDFYLTKEEAELVEEYL